MFFWFGGTIITALLTIDPNLFGRYPGEKTAVQWSDYVILFFTVVFANFAVGG